MLIIEFFVGTLTIFVLCAIISIIEKTKIGFIPIAILLIILTIMLGKTILNITGGM